MSNKIEIVERSFAKPSDEILKKYADLLIIHGLEVKEGDVVSIKVPMSAYPILKFLQNSVLEHGGHPECKLIAEGLAADFYELASDDQLTLTNPEFEEALVNKIDKSVYIVADYDKYALKDVDPAKIMKAAASNKNYRKLIGAKENAGDFQWTLAAYATPHMAEDVGLTIDEYWEQIINACNLNEPTSEAVVEKTRSVSKYIIDTAAKLSDMNIQKVHMVADGTDITVGIGSNRKWIGASGNNLPSFEIFTSPNRYEINGHIQFTEPLFRDGNRIENVFLKIENGKVIESSATMGNDYLTELLAVDGGNMIGEFSLTGNYSTINKFTGNTLLDENVGGPEGNTHIAIGSSYKDCYKGDVSTPTDEEWLEMGYNDSAVHTDIVATSNRTVIATLESGEEVLIYKDGEFQI